MSRRYDRQFRAAGQGGISIPNAMVTLWDSDGAQITTGITDLTGTTIVGGILTCDSYGYAPGFVDTADRADIYAIGSLTGEIPGVDRVHLEPTDTDDRVTAVEAAVTSLSTALEGVTTDVVSTNGGSIITIPEGDTTTQALIVRLPTGDRSTAPDTMAMYVNTGTSGSPVWRRTGYFNESGMIRVISIAANQTPFRVKVYDATQSANLFEVTDLDNVAMGGFGADGSVFGPNIGSARVSSGTAEPSGPRAGDLWTDISDSLPVLKVYDGTGWLPMATASIPAPASAPDYVDSTSNFVNGYSLTMTAPVADSLLAILSWNTINAVLTPPAGWTLVAEMTGSSGRSGLWKASGGVSALTWAWDTNLTQPKVTGVILGYEQCTILDEASAFHTGSSSGVHVCPDLTVGTVPSTLLRIWWDKASTSTSVTLPGGVTQRAEKFGTGTSSCSIAAADAALSATGAVGTASATFNATTTQAGGYTLALVAV